MARKTSFFNGIPYDAEDVNDRFAYMFSDGIIAGDTGVGDALQTTLKNSLTLNVAPGIYHIRGAVLEVYEDGEDVTLAAADPDQPRIDTIAVEYNLSVSVNTVRIIAVTGTPSSSPVPPELEDSALRVQQPLAHVRVPAASLTAGTITDARNKVCRVLTQTYAYGSSLPQSGREGDVFFLLTEE